MTPEQAKRVTESFYLDGMSDFHGGVSLASGPVVDEALGLEGHHLSDARVWWEKGWRDARGVSQRIQPAPAGGEDWLERLRRLDGQSREVA